jgi:hypothetical protein
MLWEHDWAYGVPMMLLMTIFHVTCLVLLTHSLNILERSRKTPNSLSFFLLVSIYIAIVVIFLHGLEAMGWALLYTHLGAVLDYRSAMLYSLNAFTAYGHESMLLAPQWRLLGAIEAMNGLVIFGLTTAFVFAALSRFRPHGVARSGE